MDEALRHVLSEQQKLLKREDSGELTSLISALGELALRTSRMLAEGFNRARSTAALTREAKDIEATADALSESLWRPIQVSVSAIYERIEKSMQPTPGKYGFAAEVRAHYHNLRLRLIEQLVGARMLALSSDLGDESERIWQQFLERHLGPLFRVLRGGFVYDHEGNKSCQIDLIVVPADAHVFVPGDSEGGKAHVLIDTVIAAIMVTANLTSDKLISDWKKLQSLPLFAEQAKDYPQLAEHPWPLCYVVAAQSDSAEELKAAWLTMCADSVPRVVPQFVIALDTGFIYSGARRWPAPQFPTNYTAATDVHIETGVYAGLGLAWLIAQHQGRLAVIQNQALGAINRFARLIDRAMLRAEGVPPTYSRRFDTMFQRGPIAGVMEWGSVSCWAHNKLQLRCIARTRPDTNVRSEIELLQPGANPGDYDWRSYTEVLRWFTYDSDVIAGRLIAVEEWMNHKSAIEHKRRIAVFDSVTGKEITGPLVDTLNSPAEVESIRPAVEPTLPADTSVPSIPPESVS